MKISFIGAGNIATAIISGVLKKEVVKKEDIVVYDISKDALAKHKLNELCTTEDINQATECGVIFLTVKPQFYNDVLNQLKDIKNKIIVTVAPGITIESVKNKIDKTNKVVRTMPNTSMLIGEGMTVMSKDESITDDEFMFIKTIFESASKVIEINEELIDATIGLSGSSPAYVYMMIDALADGGVLNGLDKKTSITLAAQAVMGAAKMVLESEMQPMELKDMVCSPKGTTIRAVKALEDNGFRKALLEATEACYKRATELK